MQQPPPPPPGPPPLPPAPPQQHQPPQQQQPDKPKDSGIPYIGSRISLISKTDIRYEGFLFNIDTRQSMVALQSVRSFGTEGRRAEHIPPSNQVLQFAAFKASEIKDLHVCEAAPPHQQAQQVQQPQQPPYNAYQQQAPQAPQAPRPVQQTPTLLTPGNVSNAQQTQHSPKHSPPQPPNQTQNQNQPPPQLTAQEQYAQYEQRANAILAQQTNYNEGRRQQHADHPSTTRTIPGMGGHLLKRKERRVPGSTDDGAAAAAASATQDFNFAERLNAFNKEEEFSKLDDEQPKQTHYQKSSFFDTISCDALDRLEGHRGRMTGFEERKLNAETFGAVSLNGRRNYRRGGGGGNSGGGRGNGRGGNNNGNRRRGRGGGQSYHSGVGGSNPHNGGL